MRYLYLLKDPISKEVVYIGETSDPKTRYQKHIYGTGYTSKEKKEWTIGLRAIGLKPLFEIVDNAETKKESLIKENLLIVQHIKKGCKLFNLNNNKTLKQYSLNGTLIAEYCTRSMAESITGIRPCMSQLSTGNFQWSYGDFDHSLALKKNAKKTPVIQIDESGKIINEFEGVRAAEKATGVDHSTIRVAALRSKKAGGFYWKYKE